MKGLNFNAAALLRMGKPGEAVEKDLSTSAAFQMVSALIRPT